MGQFQFRTDLALETGEKYKEDGVEIKGVSIEETELYQGEIKKTVVQILTENGAKSMGRPKGSYITLESGGKIEEDKTFEKKLSLSLTEVLKELLPRKESPISVLVVGLGNREVTPDALGPKVVDRMMITRHVIKEFGKYAYGEDEMNRISSIVPGVMAQTGMESLEIIRGVIKETGPDCVIVVDALAARSIKRLCKTIQITDTGIHPGSGIGNHRQGLCKESLGVPVIAIGIPTVVDAATIVFDTLEVFPKEISETIVSRMIAPGLQVMFVTPKDIDGSVGILSEVVAEGINCALVGEN